MANVATLMEDLNSGDPDRKESLLSDLAELLTRSGYRGEAASFSFHNPKIAALPDRLTEEVVRLIARRVGLILLDTHEAERVRAASAFVLGKTHIHEGLAAIVETISSPGPLPFEVARQCAFSFDTLLDSCGDAVPEVELRAIGRHFVRHGVPWDATSERVVVNDL